MRLRFAWPLLLFMFAYCSSPATVCPDPQLFLNGLCVDLCEDFGCDDSNPCTSEECVVNEQDLTPSCIRTDAVDGRACETPEISPGVCMAGQCTGVCTPPDCGDANDCTIDGTCNVSTAQCEGGRDAQEDTVCNGTGVCDGAGNCLECNRPQQCDDDKECTEDTCNEGTCSHESTADRACDYMGSSGICDDQGNCGEAPPNCDPNPCTDTGNDCTESRCDPADGSCSVENLGQGAACNDAPGGYPGTCDAGACIGLCEGKQCPAPPVCLMAAMCNPQTGVCEDGDPVTDPTDCDAGTPAGGCLGGMCVPIAPDDDVDPVSSLMITFDRTPPATSTNRVSYPLGDNEDRVPYRISPSGSLGFSGALKIKLRCSPITEHIKLSLGADETGCGGTVVDMIVTDVSGNFGSATVTATGGEGTFVEWTLTAAACGSAGNEAKKCWDAFDAAP